MIQKDTARDRNAQLEGIFDDIKSIANMKRLI